MEILISIRSIQKKPWVLKLGKISAHGPPFYEHLAPQNQIPMISIPLHQIYPCPFQRIYTRLYQTCWCVVEYLGLQPSHTLKLFFHKKGKKKIIFNFAMFPAAPF